MKLLKSIIILCFICISASYAQEVSTWTVFIEQDLNAQSKALWTATNGSIDEAEEGLSFKSGGEDRPVAGGQTNTHHLALDAEQELALSEKMVRITVSAKQPSENAAKTFAMAYSTNDSGNSGWKKFEATDTWADYSFTYDVPKLNRGRGDYIGIVGDFLARDNATLFRSIKIEVQDLNSGSNNVSPVVEEAQSATENTSSVEVTADSNIAETQNTYTVKVGDSLSIIARNLLGDGTRWPEIYEANKEIIENPSIVQVGTELIIPSR